MIAAIFEVEPAEGRFDAYLDFAARLKPSLEKTLEEEKATDGKLSSLAETNVNLKAVE